LKKCEIFKIKLQQLIGQHERQGLKEHGKLDGVNASTITYFLVEVLYMRSI